MAQRKSPVGHLGRIVSVFAAGAASMSCAAPTTGVKAMSPPSQPDASTATKPEHLHLALADAINRRDVDALLALYADDATLVPEPGTAVAGAVAIRKAL